MRTPRRTNRAAAVAVGGLVVLGALLLARAGRHPAGNEAATRDDEPGPVPALGAVPAAPPVNGEPAAPVEQPPLRGADATNLTKIFERVAQYPPTSRPLKGTEVHLVAPDAGDKSPLVVAGAGQGFTKDDEDFVKDLDGKGEDRDEILRRLRERVRARGGRSLAAEVVFDDINLGFGETMHASVAMREDGRYLPFQIRAARIVRDDDAGRADPPVLGSAEVATVVDGADGSRFRVSWRAPSEDARYWGMLALAVDAMVDGQPYTFNRSFSSTPQRVAVFNGRNREAMRDGSLVVEVGITGYRDAYCTISGLFYAGDTALAYASWQGSVRAGDTGVPLQAFGKVVRDRGFRGGPVKLRQLRGVCENLGFPSAMLTDPVGSPEEALARAEARDRLADQHNQANEPTRLDMPTVAEAFTTAPHAPEEFSDAEWTSPVKAHRTELLEKIQASREALAVQ